jgi:hypothetical protein
MAEQHSVFILFVQIGPAEDGYQTLNLKVVGSNPIRGSFFATEVSIAACERAMLAERVQVPPVASH